MRFIYKIHSGYDGFRPAVIRERMKDGRLALAWKHYIDVVEKGWECWIYFHGPHRFENGVYVKGIVDDIDLEARQVCLRVRNYSPEKPIAPRGTSTQIAELVAPRYRQVFAWPEEWTVAPECGLEACKNRRCADCSTWKSLPLIPPDHARPPRRLRWSEYEVTVPAHWIIPRRCYETQIEPKVRELTERFSAFKLGEMDYAFPFARAMFKALRRRDLLKFDCVVPIPLSPEKLWRREKHRVLALARELGMLLGVPTREMLRLTRAVSKRQLLSEGYTTPYFEYKYRTALRADVPDEANRILLVDDVMTRGSTAAQAVDLIRETRPGTHVVIATAGQMIVKEVVVDDGGFRGKQWLLNTRKSHI